MTRAGLQISVAAMLGLIAGIAFNLYLFRVGWVYGLIGLNVTKHVAVAFLCQALGVNRTPKDVNDRSIVPQPLSVDATP